MRTHRRQLLHLGRPPCAAIALSCKLAITFLSLLTVVVSEINLCDRSFLWSCSHHGLICPVYLFGFVHPPVLWAGPAGSGRHQRLCAGGKQCGGVFCTMRGESALRVTVRTREVAICRCAVSRIQRDREAPSSRSRPRGRARRKGCSSDHCVAHAKLSESTVGGLFALAPTCGGRRAGPR